MHPPAFRWLVFLTAGGLFFQACAPAYQPVYVPHGTAYTPIDSALAPDPTLAAMIAPYKTRLDEKVNEVIGQAARKLTKGRGESTLGNFVADLTQIQAAKYANQPVDMGLVADGGLRVPIDSGNITVNDIFELMPFENALWILTLNGETVRKLFTELAQRSDLSVSNSRVTVQNNQAVTIEIGGKPFDPNKTYTLATTDYLALGGSDLPLLKEAIQVTDLNVRYRDAIIDYIRTQQKQGRRIDARIENRVMK